MHDLIIVGSGPSGLSCALEAQRAGLDYLVLEKGTITDSIYHYPISMVFFTTKELIEIGDYPLTIFNAKPTREEALHYYSRFVLDNKIAINTYEEVTGVQGKKGDFLINTKNNLGETREYKSRTVIVATGVFDNPRMLNIPGEDLSNVSHYFKEAHPYVGKRVLVIGGRNSAAEASLDLYRAGASVCMSVRDSEFSHLKYWVQPDLLNRIKEGSIDCHYRSHVREIRDREAIIELSDGHILTHECDFVLALTGYEPDGRLLKNIGVKYNEIMKPEHNPDTLETNIPGVYVAGVITAGNDSSLVFIENGRFHGAKIIPHLKNTLK